MATVQLKAGHPTGTYRRGGFVFHAGEPLDLPAGAISEELANDTWLTVTSDATGSVTVDSALNRMTKAELLAHAESLGLEVNDEMTKADIREIIDAD